MQYHLLTGATGLLGCYLLRDLTQCGIPLAVLARSSNVESATSRIESLMARWEAEVGHPLPRPVVLEGDITNDRFGLDDQQIRWLADHCDTFIHSAASLTFVEDRHGEPWRSNLGGTRNAIEICRLARIRKLHYVSTAYVCGLRQGQIREDELDVGQAVGNAYEESKLESEKLVQATEFIEPPTIYRPAIIIGDSQTGYTTTFHGFYAPLKVVHMMVNKVIPGHVDIDPLMALCNVTGDQRKNFVPIDWVSEVMARILAEPRYHGRTYHLAPEHPVPIMEWASAMERVIRECSVDDSKRNGTAYDADYFGQFFVDQLEVYKSYWRDDPQFDCSNTREVAGDLPCPKIDIEMLARTCRYAINANFGWPRPVQTPPAIDAHQTLAERIAPTDPDARGPLDVRIGLQVNGEGGGQWSLAVSKGRVIHSAPGVNDDCAAMYYMNSDTFAELINGRQTVRQTMSEGSMLIEGNSLPYSEMADVLQELVGRENTQE